MKFRFVHGQREQYPILLMCRVLGVSRSGYYRWRQERPPSPRATRQARLLRDIRAIHEASGKTYGSPRILDELRTQGHRHSRRYIARLMRQAHLRARAGRRRNGPPRTESARAPTPGNVLNRQFAIGPINCVWAADLTALRTVPGWLYLAVVVDLGSRRVVGWALSGRPDAQLTLAALEMAVTHRRPPRGLVHHSDRGIHYTCAAYQARLQQLGFTPSLSRLGNCWDNAVVESFFHTLKVERIHHRSYRSHREARQDLFGYIEAWYNRQRRHSTLGSLSPAEYERRLSTVH